MKNGGLLLWMGAFLLIVGGGVCITGITDGGSSGDEPAGFGASMLIAGLLLWERGKRKESRTTTTINTTPQVDEKSVILPVIVGLLILSGLSSAANSADDAESSADSALNKSEQLDSRVDRIESYLNR